MTELRGEAANSQGQHRRLSARGDKRRPFRDWRERAFAGGLFPGTGDRALKPLLLGLCVLATSIVAVNAVSVITILHDQPGKDPGFVILCEASSAISFAAFAPIVWFALGLAPVGARPFWRFPLLHVSAALVFSTLHIGGFVALRALALQLTGHPYRLAGLDGGFGYEMSKDMFGYVLALCTFWAMPRLIAAPAAPHVHPRTFDILDGTRLIRVSMNEILAVCSAGNYVEFVLKDGRRPMMRRPLSALEAELSGDGFVRTHRSWLANAMQVTGLKPSGSGDYEVELGDLKVPLSRRFPDALSRLRAG